MLILPIKKKWFDMILSGEKKEEYREIKPYYTTRLNKIFNMVDDIPVDLAKTEVKFTNGYGNKVPSFIADCHLEKRAGKEEWGAEPNKEYYVLVIEKICWKSMDGLGGYLDINKEEKQNEIRLIDADKLIETLHESLEGDSALIEDYKFLGIDDFIESQATIYNIENKCECEDIKLYNEIENVLRQMTAGYNYREHNENMIEKIYPFIKQIIEDNLRGQKDEGNIVGPLAIDEYMVVTAMMMALSEEIS